MKAWPNVTLRPAGYIALLCAFAGSMHGQRGPRRARATEVQDVRIDLAKLYTAARAGELDGRTVYSTVGRVRRTTHLDARRMFLFMHPVAGCCARGVAVGFYVRYDRVADLKDRSIVHLRGRLRAASTPKRPRSRLARVVRGLVRPGLVLEPLSIEPHKRELGTLDRAAVRSRASFDTFLRALRLSGLDRQMRKRSPYTLLLPIDAAFAKLPKKHLAALFAPENRTRLRQLIRRHVVPGRLTRADLARSKSITTLGGQRLRVHTAPGSVRVKVANARVLFEDRDAHRQTLIAIDSVILRPTSASPAPKREVPSPRGARLRDPRRGP